MAGASAKTTVIGLRVPNTMAEVWQAQALEAGTPLSTFVLQLLIDKPVNVLTDSSAALVEQESKLADARKRIAELEAALRVWAPKSWQQQPNADVVPDYPSQVRHSPPVGGGKTVAAVLPVAGTQFPPRPTHLRGQEPGKKGSKS